MDKMTRYRELLKRLLNHYIELANRSSQKEVPSFLVADDEHGHYLWMNLGWEQHKRISATTVYVRLENGKIWVEEDWTEGLGHNSGRPGLTG
jgi:hypothetical protein